MDLRMWIQELKAGAEMVSAFTRHPEVSKYAGVVASELAEMLALNPPTGYDVYCAQDAPAFATWERVAWFADRGSASHWATNEKYFYEAVNYKVIEPDAIHIDMIAHGEGDRKFRILPAGSPPPGNEVSE